MVDRNGSLLPRSTVGKTSIVFAASFIGLVAATVFLNHLPRWVLILYLLASLSSFIAYANDKFAATRKRWRTAESTLHFIDLIGGWPGAILAQQIFRHKTQKLSFRIVFWFTVIANCSVLAWFAMVSLQMANSEQAINATLQTQILAR